MQELVPACRPRYGEGVAVRGTILTGEVAFVGMLEEQCLLGRAPGGMQDAIGSGTRKPAAFNSHALVFLGQRGPVDFCDFCTSP